MTSLRRARPRFTPLRLRIGLGGILGLGLLGATGACSHFEHGEESTLLAPEEGAGDDTVLGFEVPDAPPLRDPYTTYLEVRRDDQRLGYVVRYDAVPTGRDVARRYREGTLFIEDAQFQRLGFVTAMGRGYRFRAHGNDAEELGRGTLEQHLPHFFGTGPFTVLPIR